MSWLLLLFVGLPLIELQLLLMVGARIGPGPTLALVVATGVLGWALARREGLAALAAVQAELAQGRVPARALAEALAILLAGVLLLTPGLLTDAAGLLLLLPATRQLALRALHRSWERAVREGRARVHRWGPPGGGASAPGPGAPPGGGRVVDREVVVHPPSPEPGGDDGGAGDGPQAAGGGEPRR